MQITLQFSEQEFGELLAFSLQMGCKGPEEFLQQLTLVSLAMSRDKRPQQSFYDGEFVSWMN